MKLGKKQKTKKNPWHKNKIIVSFFKIKNSRVVAIMIFLQRVFVWWEKAKIVFVNGLDRCLGEIIVAVDGYSRYRVGISATCPYLRWGGFIPRKMAPWDYSRSFTICISEVASFFYFTAKSYIVSALILITHWKVMCFVFFIKIINLSYSSYK